MAKYLDYSGLQYFWSKVKSYVTSAVSSLKGTFDAYTVNGKKISTNPTLGAGDVGAVAATEKGAPNGVATLGSDGKVPQEQLPTLDLSLYKVVETLPTEGINANKIYLVLSTSTGTQNIYKEYIYTGDTSAAYDASKWEELGEYKADVDLTQYVKFIDLATSEKAGAMSTADKKKIDGISEGATADSALTTEEIDEIVNS